MMSDENLKKGAAEASAFIKAVRERDGADAAVQEMIQGAGAVIAREHRLDEAGTALPS